MSRSQGFNLAFDATTMREALSGPGMDTRSWVSLGWVQPDTTDGHSVSFNDEQGNPLPNGVRVLVKLEPSGTLVSALVGSQVSGEGEAEYHPMGPGDVVVVVMPNGNEIGCVIICRISLSQDTYPQKVAGMDVTQNNVNFKRLTLPYVLETAGSYLIRHALTGASWSIDPTGNIIFTDGEGNSLSLSQSVISLGEVTNTALIQIDPAKLTVALQSGGTSLVLDDSGNTMGNAGATLMTGGNLQLITSGGGYATGHGITLEQVMALFKAWMFAIGTLNPAALTGAILKGLVTTVFTSAGFNPTALAAGVLTSAETTATIPLMLQVPPDPTGLAPGFARPGLLF